jgi:hypothetical protein
MPEQSLKQAQSTRATPEGVQKALPKRARVHDQTEKSIEGLTRILPGGPQPELAISRKLPPLGAQCLEVQTIADAFGISRRAVPFMERALAGRGPLEFWPVVAIAILKYLEVNGLTARDPCHSDVHRPRYVLDGIRHNFQPVRRAGIFGLASRWQGAQDQEEPKQERFAARQDATDSAHGR